MSFLPSVDLLRERDELRGLVDGVLAKLAHGERPDDIERQRVDLKEEAGRRGVGGVLLPGQAHNLAAAAQLADEVACFANTLGGGALVVGVENKTGDLLGTDLDPEWLRRSIYERVDLAPVVEERIVSGTRLLVIYTAMAGEPVEDTGNRIRWRVGDSCAPVDRAEWWVHRQQQAGYDSMAVSTGGTLADVSAGAMVAVRRYVSADAGTEASGSTSSADVLRELGVLQPSGRLTQAGALVLCAADHTHLELTVLDVEGGDVLAAPDDLSQLSLIEQLAEIERRLDGQNTSITLRASFAERPVRRLPPTAVREAVLNALAHRDWMTPEPVRLTWVQEDSALTVISPGGFSGGITADTVLTRRYARHPALADLFRALSLVEKQGLGVDRMVREMVALGHRPPVIVEEEGPVVRVRLAGGQPVVPVMVLTGRIEPVARRRDVRIALIVDTLLRRAHTTPDSMARVLQRTPEEALEALETAAECRVDAEPLVEQYKGNWLLSTSAIRVLESAGPAATRPSRTILTYRRPADSTAVVRSWLADNVRITSGDHARLTGITQAGALNQLDRMEAAGQLVRGDGKGRNAHFLPGPHL